MREGDFGAFGNGPKPDLYARFAGVFHAAFPPPAHDDPLGPHDLEEFAAALVLGAVEHAKAQAIAATDARIGFRQKHGAGVGTPPMRDAFGGRDRVEDNRNPGPDTEHKREAGHRPVPRASASLFSA